MEQLERIYVIGYIGSDREMRAEALASGLGCPVLSLDAEIERLDGRSVKRICMIHGEHAYRNKEFEVLSRLADPAYDLGLAKDEQYPARLVVVCGDGVVLDEMSLAILQKAQTVFVEEDVDVLWRRAKEDDTLPHAFMYGSDDAAREKTFRETYERRLPLYRAACAAPTGGSGAKEAAQP